MAKRNLNLLTNNEVVNDEESTLFETTDVSVKTTETTISETTEVVAEPIEVVTETTEVAEDVVEEVKPDETVVDVTENNILAKRIYDIKPGVYTIQLQLNDTGELVRSVLNIRPSKQNESFLVSDYITHYYTSKSKYKNFTIISIK